MPDVFISYSRRDGPFVRDLHAFLVAAGRDVWVDWEDIPPASQWERDIGDSIDGAESFVFVVSASSLASEYCTTELGRAQADGKRVVPIACDAVDPGTAPPALRELNWIWCRDGDDRDSAFEKLTRALDTDLAWAHTHTRLLVRAVEWDERRDPSLLLRGRDLEDAAQALALNAGKEPAPTELQQQYVLASRQSSSRRQRIVLGSVVLALVVSLALGAVALLKRNEANDRAQVARAQALAAQSVEALASAPVTALDDGVKAIETKRTGETRTALRRAILANPIEYVLPAPTVDRDDVEPVLAFSADGSLLLGLRPDGVLRLWRSANGRTVGHTPGAATAAALGPGRLVAADAKTLRVVPARGRPLRRRAPAGQRVVGVGFAGSTPLALVAGRGRAAVLDVATGRTVALRGRRLTARDAVFSSDGSRVVTIVPYEQPGRVWDVRTGRLLMTIPGAASVAISRDGRFVATSGEGPASLWSVDTRARLARIGDETSTMVFSPDGRLFAAIAGDGAVRVRRPSTGELLATLPGFGTLAAGLSNYTTRFSPGAAFTPDGRLLAVAAADGIVRVWELASVKQVSAVGMGWVNTLAFAPRGGRLAGMTWNGDVVVARAPASIALRTGYVPSSCYAAFDPTLSNDGKRLVAPTPGGAGVWSIDGERLQRLPTLARPRGNATIGAASFSGDGTVVAGAAAANLGCLAYPNQRVSTGVWRTGHATPFARLPEVAGPLQLDRRGTLLAGYGAGWRTATGARVPALDGVVGLSPDGRLAAVRRRNEIAVVRVGSGETVSVLPDFGRFGSEDVSAAFSPDGSRLVTRRIEELRLWNPATGRSIARLGRHGQSVVSYGFGGNGLVLVRFARRAMTFDAADGSTVLTAPGSFAAISRDGTLGAIAREDGALDVVDLATGLRVAVQTDTGAAIVSATFGPTASVLVAGDEDGVVHVLRCEICGGDAELLARARERLALVSGYRPKRPPIGGVIA